MDDYPPLPPDWTPTPSSSTRPDDSADSPGFTPRDGMLLSLTAYQQELARRQREVAEADTAGIRTRCRSFAGFVREAWKIIEPGTTLRWNWHLDAMCSHLEAITFKQITPWLIINVPPGSSKSTIVSVLWQAWEWGPCGMRHLRYVSTSFEEGNVKRDTRKTRNLINSEWYKTLWPEVELTRTGELSFENSSTGTREGVTFSAITGKRGDRVLVDDPHSLRGAESETERNKATREFLEGGLNRTNDALNSAMIIVMQRLHEDDLTGVLLAKDLGFIHLFIPMEFEPERCCTTPLQVTTKDGTKRDWTDPRSYDGELMDPIRFPREAIERQKKAGEYSWNGQYQQRPAPREGGMFKVDEIEIVEYAPGGGVSFRGWDLAASTNRDSAYTCGALMRRVGGVIYVLDVRRGRFGPADLRRAIKAVVDADWEMDPSITQSLPQDPAQAGKVQKHDFAEMLMGRKVRITPEGKSGKVERAEPFAAHVGLGMVKLVRGAWNSAYIDELRTFPAGSFKDQVDASSRCFGELVKAVPVPTNAAPEIVEVDDDLALVGWDDDPWAPDM